MRGGAGAAPAPVGGLSNRALGNTAPGNTALGNTALGNTALAGGPCGGGRPWGVLSGGRLRVAGGSGRSGGAGAKRPGSTSVARGMGRGVGRGVGRSGTVTWALLSRDRSTTACSVSDGAIPARCPLAGPGLPARGDWPPHVASWPVHGMFPVHIRRPGSGVDLWRWPNSAFARQLPPGRTRCMFHPTRHRGRKQADAGGALIDDGAVGRACMCPGQAE